MCRLELREMLLSLCPPPLQALTKCKKIFFLLHFNMRKIVFDFDKKWWTVIRVECMWRLNRDRRLESLTLWRWKKISFLCNLNVLKVKEKRKFETFYLSWFLISTHFSFVNGNNFWLLDRGDDRNVKTNKEKIEFRKNMWEIKDYLKAESLKKITTK